MSVRSLVVCACPVGAASRSARTVKSEVKFIADLPSVNPSSLESINGIAFWLLRRWTLHLPSIWMTLQMGAVWETSREQEKLLKVDMDSTAFQMKFD